MVELSQQGEGMKIMSVIKRQRKSIEAKLGNGFNPMTEPS